MQRLLTVGAVGATGGYAAMRQGLFGSNEWAPPAQHLGSRVDSRLFFTRIAYTYKDASLEQAWANTDPEELRHNVPWIKHKEEIYYRPVLVPIDQSIEVHSVLPMTLRGDKISA